MLYTMLVGRYPFHGQEHSGLFAKIRRGHFSLPDSLSSRAKCLIRCLLRKEPEDRLTTEDVLIHPWMTHVGSRERGNSNSGGGSGSKRSAAAVTSGSTSGGGLDSIDQTVPDVLEKRQKMDEHL
jgi:tribbles-like protein